MQTQSVEAALPSGESVLIGHLLQLSGPDVSLYVPAIHLEHVPPLAPVKPALHSQEDKESLPSGAAEFAGHFNGGFGQCHPIFVIPHSPTTHPYPISKHRGCHTLFPLYNVQVVNPPGKHSGSDIPSGQ